MNIHLNSKDAFQGQMPESMKCDLGHFIAKTNAKSFQNGRNGQVVSAKSSHEWYCITDLMASSEIMQVKTWSDICRLLICLSQ